MADDCNTPPNVSCASPIQASQANEGTGCGSSLRPRPLGADEFIKPLNAGLFASRLAFSVRETAEILGVSDKTVRRLIARRLLKPSRALRHLLIPKKEVERFLDET